MTCAVEIALSFPALLASRRLTSTDVEVVRDPPITMAIDGGANIAVVGSAVFDTPRLGYPLA